MKRVIYCLRNKIQGTWASIFETTNDGAEFSGSTTCELDITNDPMERWETDRAWKADWVRTNSTDWYNSSRTTPKHPSNWEPEEWEVVEIEIVEEHKVIDFKAPSDREVFEATCEVTRMIEYWLKGGTHPDYGRVSNYWRDKRS